MGVVQGNSGRRVVILGVLVVVGVALVGSPVVAAEQPAVTAPAPFQQTSPADNATANNSTTQHEDPETVDEAGDAEALRQWLASDLARRLDASAVEISQDEYERGQAVLGDEFEARLEQYVTVAGETDGDADEEAADRVRDAAATQRAYAETVEDYETTYDRYQEARRNGNTTAARRYARALTNQSAEIRELNTTLVSTYAELNQSGIRTTQAAERISNTTREVIELLSQVQTETFIETRLAVTAPSETAAFTDPLPVTGRLTTANGTGVANQSVRLRIATRSYTVRTDRNGSFTVQYRPVSVPVNASNTTVSYRPAVTAPYLGTTATLPIQVRQVTPSITTQRAASMVQFGEAVEVAAQVTVDGRPVPSVPVTMRFAGRTVNRTSATGTVRLTRRVPASIATGRTAVTVGHDREGLAVGPARTTTQVTVTETATTITAEAAVASPDTITVTGRLTTAGGTPVSEQPVRIVVGETIVTTVTDATGAYRQQVDPTEAAVNNTTIPVTVRFDGAGTNLGGSTATTTVSVPQVEPNSGSEGFGNISFNSSSRDLSNPQWVLAGVLVGLVVLGGYAWYWRRGEQSPSDAGGDAEAGAGRSEAGGPAVDAAQEWLAHARAALTASETGGSGDVSTMAAYAALRAAFERFDDVSAALTHREFRAACEARVAEPETAAVETVIDGYEQAVFARGIDAAEAEAVVAAAETVIQQVHSET